jgi:hypothetical protein
MSLIEIARLDRFDRLLNLIFMSRARCDCGSTPGMTCIWYVICPRSN